MKSDSDWIGLDWIGLALLVIAMIAAGAGLSNLSAFVRRNRRKYICNHQ